MRIECKILRVSVCLFALLCLSSVGYASQPSADVHFCRVLDFEDMWARDSLYAATKHALNLNVGDPRTVRMIYFLPNDRPFRQEVVDSMKVTIRQVQTFFAEQMQAHGYGNKAFRFEADVQGEPMVHRVEGQHLDSHYFDDTPGTVINELEQAFDLDANIYFIVIDNSINAIGSGGLRVPGVGGRRGKNGGLGLVTGKFSFESAAHELGHAFGLSHDFNDVAYIMSYGSDQDRLSACNAEFLAVHPYFNLDTPIEEALLPSIELLSPQEYPAGSKSISVHIKISDLEELHQVLLFVRTREPHLAAGFLEVKGCRGLAGDKDAVVEFEYDGVIPSAVFTSLSDPSVHPIYVQAVDTEGNVGRAYFEFLEISPHHIATLEEHKNEVYSIAFSPDGSTLASGSLDGLVKLWDVSTRRDIDTFDAHTGWVASLAFSPNGMMLASGSDDQTVKLWEVSTRRNLATFEEHWGRVVSVVFSPDGSTLASGSLDGLVKLWEVSTRRNLATFEGHMWGGSVAFSPDGMILAAGSGDGTIKLWDVATEKNIATFEGHTREVISVAFSPDGETLASGSDNGTVKLWDVATRTNIATFEEDRGRVSSVAFSPDGTILASGAWDKTVNLWDVATRTNLATLEGHRGLVHSVAFSPEGTMLASGSGDHTIRLWDVSEWRLPRPQNLVKISGDNQQDTPDAELAMPLVVEVRDQYGNPLQHARVTFAVTAGEGKLSGRFTVENTTTDANGRAQSTLTPGPGTNTVKASIPGIEVTFNAVGVGMPTTSVIGGDYQQWRLPNGATVRLEKGHISGDDKAVAFSPDGQSLAVASAIGVWLYDVATLRGRALLTGHKGEVSSVSFSPDGTILASGSSDHTIKLWKVQTEENIATFEGHSREVTSIAFSPDGTILASGSSDHTIKLWKVQTEENIATFEGHSREVTSIAFSPDGTTLASGSWDETVRLWDVATRTNIATFLEHTREVTAVAFSPDGTTLVSVGGDRMIRLWEVSTRTSTVILRHKDTVTSIAFSPDGTTLALASYDEVRLWDIVTRQNVVTLSEHMDEVTDVAFSPDGTILASTSYGEVKLWDIATQNTSILTEHLSGVRSVVFSPDGTTLVLLSRNRLVRMWNVAMRINLVAPFEHIHGISSVAFSPNGTILATGSWQEVKLWDIEIKENIGTLKGHTDWVNSMAFSPDGTILASGSGRNVMLWNVATGTNIATFSEHTSRVTAVVFSPDGTVLASGSHDKTIRLWNVETEKNIATLPYDERVRSVSFSPDGTILASGSGRNVMLWDVLTRENIAILEGHTNNIASVSFSPDGTVLASGSGDRTVKLWDVAAGRSIATFEGHKDWVWSVAFLPYGTTLASGSDDGTALLWDISEYITPVVNIPDANLRAVIRDALGKSRFAPITTTDMASLTTLNASNRNIRDLTGLEFATNLTELNLVGNRLSSLSINTHIPVLQNRGVGVLFDKTPTPDFDGDGTVGFADFLLFVAQFGFGEDDEGYDVWFDLDGDGMIGFGDFLIFANNFGKSASSN